MKFFHFLTFAVAASATPMPSLELGTEKPKDLAARQANNLAQVVLTTVNTVSTTVEQSLDIISTYTQPLATNHMHDFVLSLPWPVYSPYCSID